MAKPYVVSYIGVYVNKRFEMALSSIIYNNVCRDKSAIDNKSVGPLYKLKRCQGINGLAVGAGLFFRFKSISPYISVCTFC
jgi:hypothetical protein